jgi:hypothetical protein
MVCGHICGNDCGWYTAWWRQVCGTAYNKIQALKILLDFWEHTELNS